MLSSNVLWNQHRKHHNVKSERRKLSQGANENLDKKKEIAWRTEKGKWLSVIFNRPLLSLTHFPVPSTVNEEFLKKNVVSRNISPVKRKVEYSLNTLWVLRMMSGGDGWCHVPWRGEAAVKSIPKSSGTSWDGNPWGFQMPVEKPSATHAVWRSFGRKWSACTALATPTPAKGWQRPSVL